MESRVLFQRIWQTGSKYFAETTTTDIETYLLKLHEF